MPDLDELLAKMAASEPASTMNFSPDAFVDAEREDGIAWHIEAHYTTYHQ
jgi:hypothetical protein